MSADYAAQNKNNKDYVTVNDSSTFYIKFNQKRAGKDTVFANKNIRKAIALAIDKQSYTDTVLKNNINLQTILYQKVSLLTQVTKKIIQKNLANI